MHKGDLIVLVLQMKLNRLFKGTLLKLIRGNNLCIY
jgi:hypothetical protein